ncbi:DUF4942 domain-containing protein [Sphingobacterium kyonggiense]
MFNSDFYPTPLEVINIMLGAYDLQGKTVLEPSAGKGDIIDALKAEGANVICCEINPDLATISASKAQLIANDFLKVTSEQISHVDFIVMNPPFSADEHHINHAWNIAPAGCQIVALCNWETLRNDYSKSRRQLTATISNYGYSDNIGDLFSDAERSTGIDIGLIRLTKPGVSEDFSDFFSNEDDEIERQENGIMSYNAVREVVQRYVNAIRLHDEVLSNAVKMNALTDGLGVRDLVFTCSQKEVPTTRDQFAKELQKKSWAWIINKMNLQKYSTRGLMQDINKFVEQQKSMKFTMKNIYKMLDVILQTTDQRMDKALLEVFDNLTQHHHENRWNVEGWKTNSHYLVNRKFIEPYIAPLSRWGSMDISSGRADRLDDLDKALCFLTGEPWIWERNFYRNVSCKKSYGEWFDWGFFEVKLFKKGTGHFKFKNENVWALFNQQIARIKGFPLPESIRKAA